MLFLTRFDKPFDRRMADKITEKAGKKGQVVNPKFPVNSFAESWLRNGRGEHSLHKRRKQRALEIISLYMNVSLNGMKSQHSKFSTGVNLFT